MSPACDSTVSCISSLICTHVCGASYLLSGLDDTAGLSWCCCCRSGSEPVGVSERHCRASLFWGEAAATLSGGQSRREGGRKSGSDTTDSPFSSSAVSEGGDRVVSSAEGWPNHCFFHLITSSFISLYLFLLLQDQFFCPNMHWEAPRATLGLTPSFCINMCSRVPTRQINDCLWVF